MRMSQAELPRGRNCRNCATASGLPWIAQPAEAGCGQAVGVDHVQAARALTQLRQRSKARPAGRMARREMRGHGEIADPQDLAVGDLRHASANAGYSALQQNWASSGLPLRNCPAL